MNKPMKPAVNTPNPSRPPVMPHSEVGSLHEIESQMQQPPAVPTMQSAFRPPHEKPVKEGTVHNDKISHPVVTQTQNFNPPHEKLVAGVQPAYGKDHDLNQPPGYTYQAAFQPPHVEIPSNRVVKEGTKTDDKRAWISEKIKKIMNDGLNGEKVKRDQAIAAAYSMYKKEHGGK